MTTTWAQVHGMPHPLILALSQIGRRNPARAAARIARLLNDARATDLRLRSDLHALLAEVLYQAGDLNGALDAGSMAAEAAAAVTPRDWPRLTTALLVGADLAFCARHPSSIDACTSAFNAIAYQDDPDPELAAIAAALHAAAVHHADADQGYHRLQVLHRRAAPDSLLELMLATGLAAMRGEPTGPRHGRPVPLPGAVLRPRLDKTTTGWLADRITTRPARPPAVIPR